MTRICSRFSPVRLPLRTLLVRALFALPLLLALLAAGHPAAALAQQDEQPDAGSLPGAPPDAGDEPPDEDTTGHIVEVCRVTADCSPRFACDNGKCRYQGTREAKRVGCMLGPEGTVALIGLGLVAASRRRR